MAFTAGLVVLTATAPLAAQDYPALHRVEGVASGDVLNIRAEPDAGSPIIGQLAPGTRGIEVTASNSTGKWGQVNTGEATGWASLRYLSRTVSGSDLSLEPRLFCSGTEPFWFLTIDQGRAASLTTPEGDTASLPDAPLQRARGRLDSYVVTWDQRIPLSFVTRLAAMACQTAPMGFLSACWCAAKRWSFGTAAVHWPTDARQMVRGEGHCR